MIDKSFQALIFSLLIHALVGLAYVRAPVSQKAPDVTSVEVVYNKPKGYLVQDSSTAPAPDEKEVLKKLKDQERRLSRISRRVKEEQVARPMNQPQVENLADLKPFNALKTPPQSQSQKESSEENGTGESIPVTLPGLNPTLSEKTGDNFSKSVVIGGSTSGEWIPGVKEGNFTALNTDQFTYYSFFSRVSSAIRFRWVQGVRGFSQKASVEEIVTLSRIPSLTKLEITLSKTGDVLKVATLKTSGSAELDDAAIRAFWNASPLQNPPLEMAETDGLIRLYYSFQVHWQPHYMADGL